MSETFESLILEGMAARAKNPPTFPNRFYCPDGDIYHHYITDEESYAEWICPSLTLLRSTKTDKIVGYQLWGFGRGLLKIYERDKPIPVDPSDDGDDPGREVGR